MFHYRHMAVGSSRFSSLCILIRILGGGSPPASDLSSMSMDMIWTYTNFHTFVNFFYCSSVYDTSVGFNIIPGRYSSEANQSIYTNLPHSKGYPLLPPCYFIVYENWQFCCSHLPGPNLCPKWLHWVSLSNINGKLRAASPPLTYSQK